MPGGPARRLTASVRLREIVRVVHRWLGLVSGLIVFVVGLTGALYVFAPEITALYTARAPRVAPGHGPAPLAASTLARSAHDALEAAVGRLPGLTSRWIELPMDPAQAAVYVAHRDEPLAWYQVHIDPYRGDVLAVRDMHRDPMEIVRRLHQALLLPHDIGHVIVGVAILVFLALQVSGVVLWLPRRLRALRHPGALRQRLTVHWRGRARRVIFDLHRVAGVYALPVALLIALTGLVWSFAWMDRAVYWAATGGQAKPTLPPVRSGGPGADPGGAPPPDRVLSALAEAFPGAALYIVALPADAAGTIEGCVKPDADTYYRMSCAHFDQYTGARLRTEFYRDKNLGQLLQAMNYDIHVGRILGLPGRLVACAVSLVVATLPITGALTWWGGAGGRRPRAPRTMAHPPGSRPRTHRPRLLTPRHGDSMDRSRLRYVTSAVVAAALALLPCLPGPRPAGAQTPPTAPLDPVRPTTPLDPLTVRGLLDQGYGVPEATTGTKTNSLLIDVPSTIDVLSRRQLDEQALQTLPEALEWVPGVFDQNSRSGFDRFTIRGFFAGDSVFIDGLRADPRFWINQELFGMDRVEVLKGPGSVLYGQVAPGGVVNLVTKRPRFDERHYDLGLSVGSHDYYEGTFDLGGPVNKDKTIAVRFTGLYLDRGDFVDFVDKQRAYIAPAATFKLGTSTTLTVLANYIWEKWVQPLELPAEGTVRPNPNGRIPIERWVGEPAFNRTEDWRAQGGFIFEHQFNPSLRLRSTARGQYYEVDDDDVRPFELLPDQRTITRYVSGGPVEGWNVGIDTNVEWAVQTGPVSHRVLGGVDYFHDYFTNRFYFSDAVAPIDLFAPVYGSPASVAPPVYDATDTITQVGIYLQDQMKLWDKLTLLLGGRYDLAWHRQEDHLNQVTTDQDDHAFTYRAGLVYQIIPGLAAYASYATSFQPVTFGARAGGTPLEPETAQQVEGGFKVDMFGGRLTSTLAIYHLTRQNVTVDDPGNPGFSIQTGEQRSQGVELSAQARITDWWDLLAFYTYIDAEITEDTTFAVGNRLPNTPRHSAGFWSTWRVPSGPLKGLGAGFGLRYIGERYADFANTVTLPDYVVLDASVFYRRGQFSLDVNVKNLANERYFNGNGAFVFAGEPFSVLARVGWSF